MEYQFDVVKEFVKTLGIVFFYNFLLLCLGMPIPLQEMILGESGDRGMANCHSPGKGEFSAYSSGFGVRESGNKITKYRHSFESLVHNQHYTLEILGFHYM